jgi:hypothetical protein
MKRISRYLSAGVFLLAALGAVATAQQTRERRSSPAAAASSAAGLAGRAAVIVVGSAGKAAWVTSRFAARKVAWPVTRTLAVTALKHLAVPAAKKAVPMAARLALL